MTLSCTTDMEPLNLLLLALLYQLFYSTLLLYSSCDAYDDVSTCFYCICFVYSVVIIHSLTCFDIDVDIGYVINFITHIPHIGNVQP